MIELTESQFLCISRSVVSRALHDISNPMSAVLCYSEMLEEELSDSSSSGDNSMDLLSESLENLMVKYKVVRQMYGVSDDNLSIKSTISNLKALLKSRCVESHFSNSISRDQNPVDLEITNRMLVNMMLIIISNVFNIQNISVDLSSSEVPGKSTNSIKVSVASGGKSIKCVMEELLMQHDYTTDVENAQHVQIYLFHLLVKSSCALVEYSCSPETVTVLIPHSLVDG